MGLFLCRVLVGTLFLLFCSPAAGLAALFDWGTQGSYVHQFSHLLFLAAMLFFLREMYRGGLQTTPGFRSLIWACWLLALWNLDAVIGHAVDWSIRNPLILGQGLSRRLVMEDARFWVYYLHRFIHFLLLPPAFYLFYRGLKTLGREFQAEKP
ncbi:MAG: hypothetical protein JRI59_02550 [Deltaproteobacteria bacterium]|nr:hypothetical protein [Deltaproteobacteria bacterium]